MVKKYCYFNTLKKDQHVILIKISGNELDNLNEVLINKKRFYSKKSTFVFLEWKNILYFMVEKKEEPQSLSDKLISGISTFHHVALDKSFTLSDS